MIAKSAFLLLLVFVPQTLLAYELPNCLERVHMFKDPRLPVKKDILRNNTGCRFTINWGIIEGNKKPDVFDIRTSEACENIGKRLERAWQKSLLFKGEAVAHCQTNIQIKCPDRKRSCRILFELPEDDPLFDAS
jgi:hypothetical protein